MPDRFDRKIVITYSKQAFNEYLDFCNGSYVMNYTNLIDSCQAHLTVQYASNIELIRQK